MKNFKPDKIVQQRKKDWLILGGKLATRIKLDAQKGISQDPDGKPFPPYKKSYADLKKVGRATPKGVRSDRQVSPPNLRATGNMLGSISPLRATKDSVTIVFREGEKVLGNANPPARFKKKKRNIYGLNDDNWEFAKKYINDIIDNRIVKFSRKKIVIEISK